MTGCSGAPERTPQQAPQQGFNPYGNPFERRAQGTQTTSFSAGQTKIVADTRTNKLIITADADTMKVVEQLLEELDRTGQEYATTTFAIKLKNSNSEDMSYVLAKAFGTRGGAADQPLLRRLLRRSVRRAPAAARPPHPAPAGRQQQPALQQRPGTADGDGAGLRLPP